MFNNERDAQPNLGRAPGRTQIVFAKNEYNGDSKSNIFLSRSLIFAIIFFSLLLPATASQFDEKFNEFSRALGIDIINKKSPDFELVAINDERIKLSDFKGKVIFLNVWSVFCGPCRSGMPYLKKLYDKFKGSDFVLLGISLDGESEESVKKYIQEENINFPIMIDKDGEIASQFGVNATPTTFVISKDGVALGVLSGLRDWFSNEVFDLITFLQTSKITKLEEVKASNVEFTNIEQQAKPNNGIRVNTLLLGGLFVIILVGLTIVVFLFFTGKGANPE